MADAPRLDTVAPAAARANEQLTLSGAAFGARTAESAVRFRLPVAGAAPVAGTVVDWAAATIHARMPALASFGSGGPLQVDVHTTAGDSRALDVVLLEDAVPSVTTVTPARGLEGVTVTISGDRFGRPTADSAVLFQAPGPSDVSATVLSWQPGAISVRVPSLAALGGAGDRGLVVRTSWGRSAPAAFRLGELPQVSAVLPGSPAPGGEIRVTGRAFGPAATGRLELAAVYETDDPDAPLNVTPVTVTSWSDGEIVGTLPNFQGLRTTGPRDVLVTTEWGTSPRGPNNRILIESRASITCWTRLEPHARTDDLQAGLALGLQAQIHDPLWLLGRQWQLLELRGEDAGSPVTVRAEGATTPLARWQPHGGAAEDVPPGVPLEAVVERERVTPPAGGTGSFGDLRVSAEAGLQLLRALDAQLQDPRKSDDYRKRFLREYPLQLPPDAVAALDPRSRRFLGVMAGRAPDGARLHADFRSVLGANPKLPDKPPINGNDRAAAIAAVRSWYAWCDELFSQPTPGQTAWVRERMEYSFAAGSGDLVLDAYEHDGGHLDWYSFERRSAGSTLGAPGTGRGRSPFARAAIPSPVSFPGMPVPRWWELEDGRVDFGSVAAAPNELLKLVLVEFASVYGNDWFAMPVDAIPVGTLCEIGSVTVTDSFGTTIPLSPFGDGAGTDWRMFELTAQDGQADAGDQLLVLDALPATAESAPLEEIHLLRDEQANMAWAVETTVESRTGRPLDRHEEDAVRRPAPAPGTAAEHRYRLQATVPRNWIPLLPRIQRNPSGDVAFRWLARGAMRDPAGGPAIPPRGRLLDPGRPLDVYDEEIPPAGARVTRLWTLGRSADGRTHLWRGRRAFPGRGPASSGLTFDQIRPGR